MKNLKTIGLLAFAALALGACSKDNLAENAGTEPAEMVEVPVSLTSQDLTDAASDKTTSVASTDGIMDVQLVESPISTRAEGEETPPDTSKGEITSLQVVQFIDNKVVAGYYTSSYEEGGVSCPLQANNAGETSTIYFIANRPQLTVNEGESLENFKKRTFSSLKVYTDSDTENLPMVGVNENVNVQLNNTDTPIEGDLKRIYTKLVLTVSKGTGLDAHFTPTVTVKNIPTVGRIDGAEPTTADFFPTDGEDNFTDKEIEGFAFGTEFTLYIPENLQGTDTGITQASDKVGKNHANGTYIEVAGVYPDGNYDITYKIYLGADAQGYNLMRNHKYTINATLKGANINDPRVTGICNLSRKADGSVGTTTNEVGTNCYVVNKGGLEYKFLPFKGKGGDKIEVSENLTFSVLWSAYPYKYGSSTAQKDDDIITLVDTDAATAGDQPVDKDGYVHFKTTSTWGLTREGNAVICAKNASGEIVWSWHIWSTAYDPNKSDHQVVFKTNNTNAGHTEYTAMDRLLGDVSDGNNYDVAGVEKYHNVALLYQWGRKDPFIPANIESSETDQFGGTSLGNTDPGYWTAVETNATNGTVKYATLHPTTFIKGTSTNNNYDWIFATGEDAGNKDALWGNAWDSGDPGQDVGGQKVNSNNGSKSAYDPCPIGWRVAPQDAFTMFTKTGTNKGSDASADWNVKGAWDNGWHFYYQKWQDNTTPTIFWPASGYRHAGSGALSGTGAWGGSWGSSPDASGSQTACYLDFVSSYVNPLYGNGRAYGFPVRCVKE